MRDRRTGRDASPGQFLPPWVTVPRLRLYLGALLCFESIYLVLWWVGSGSPDRVGFAVDFAGFWAVAVTALGQGAASVHDLPRVALESGLPQPGLNAWLYPPTFLLAMLPFGMMARDAATGLFLGGSLLAYVLSLRLPGLPRTLVATMAAAAFPAVFATLTLGQNSLLTAALFAAALRWLPSRPVLAGLFVAGLCIKPQLGALFPIAFVLGRHWKALVSATCFSLLFWGGAVAYAGADSIPAFLEASNLWRVHVVEVQRGIWTASSTVFALARLSGASAAGAYAAHALVAASALAVCGWLWRTHARDDLKATALVLASLLVPVHLLMYDLALVGVALAFLARDISRNGGHPWELWAWLAAWAMPLQCYVFMMMHSPYQIGPLAVLGMLVLTVGRHLAEVKERGLPSLATRSPLPGEHVPK